MAVTGKALRAKGAEFWGFKIKKEGEDLRQAGWEEEKKEKQPHKGGQKAWAGGEES